METTAACGSTSTTAIPRSSHGLSGRCSGRSWNSFASLYQPKIVKSMHTAATMIPSGMMSRLWNITIAAMMPKSPTIEAITTSSRSVPPMPSSPHATSSASCGHRRV
jgi:hypothetical protein